MAKVLFFMFIFLVVAFLDSSLDPSMEMYQELKTVNQIFIFLSLFNIFLAFITIGKVN